MKVEFDEITESLFSPEDELRHELFEQFSERFPHLEPHSQVGELGLKLLADCHRAESPDQVELAKRLLRVFTGMYVLTGFGLGSPEQEPGEDPFLGAVSRAREGVLVYIHDNPDHQALPVETKIAMRRLLEETSAHLQQESACHFREFQDQPSPN